MTDSGDSHKPLLSVIIPVYNEDRTIPELLRRVSAVKVDKELIIVDDASTDRTADVLTEFAAQSGSRVSVLRHKVNIGKGGAIRTAIPHATGRFTIIQDGDLEYSPDDYPVIVNAFDDPAVDAVYGSRFTTGYPPMRLANRLVNRLLAWMVRVLYHSPITDEATCYKAFRTEVLQAVPLTCRRFEFCPEVTAKLLRSGHKIIEVPIRYEARSFAEGKKIRWTDGVMAIWTLVRLRWWKQG